MTSTSSSQESTRITRIGPRRGKVLSTSNIQDYERDGFIFLEQFIDASWLGRLQDAMQEFVEHSRSLSQSNGLFDLEAGHSAENPRLRRLVSPADLHETFWAFASESAVVDLVEDLIGPDIKFHHSKLNFKAPGGGEEVKWHQDISFWPHTNYTPLTIGVFLDDVDANMGNVGFVPGSHLQDIYDQYDGEDWIGCLAKRDVAKVGADRAVYPVGRAGSVTVHNCRTVHGSAPNRSNRGRPLLLQTYAAADAFTYTDLVAQSPHGDLLIRGQPARWARHDPRPCQVGPSRIRTIFEVQQRET